MSGGGEPGGTAPVPQPGVPAAPQAPTEKERLVNCVVAALLDGKRVSGYVWDVSADNDQFHVFETNDPGGSAATIVKLQECKAVYFVRSLTGNPHYKENTTEFPKRRRWGRPFEVVFNDGERLLGTVEIYHPDRLGFYLIPPDPKSNNLRIFIVQQHCRLVRPIDPETGKPLDGSWIPPDPVRYPAEKRIEVVLRQLRGMDVEKLSMDVYLPVPIIELWKDAFLGAGRKALTDEGMAAALAASGEPAPPPGKPDRTPPAKRLEIVLRTLAREDQAVVSQVFLVSFALMSRWRDAFLESGKGAVRKQAADEAGEGPEKVRARYEAIIVRASSVDRERLDLLDSLSDILKDDRKK